MPCRIIRVFVAGYPAQSYYECTCVWLVGPDVGVRVLAHGHAVLGAQVGQDSRKLVPHALIAHLDRYVDRDRNICSFSGLSY